MHVDDAMPSNYQSPLEMRVAISGSDPLPTSSPEMPRAPISLLIAALEIVFLGRCSRTGNLDLPQSDRGTKFSCSVVRI
jgi:hypothetical protein